ncbi:MAG: hypothetical protein OXI91_11700 [Chloroflexota bacterium]|nr:hypothetical protein [Chloroflexota bacterium]
MYEPNQDILLAEMVVEFVIDGRCVSAPARILERLSPHPQVVIEVTDVPRQPQPISRSTPDRQTSTISTFPPTSKGPSEVRLGSGVRIGVVANDWVFNQTDATLHLQLNPCVALDLRNPIFKLHFSLLNLTGDVFDWPIKLEAPPWLVNIAPVPNKSKIERELRRASGYSVMHAGTIERMDGEDISEQNAEALLAGLERFLSFVCGSSCGLTNVTGVGKTDNAIWKRWGSHHVSPWQRRRSWSDITIRNNLPDMFAAYWEKYQRRQQHFDRVLGWYVHSNEIEALDLSIILNQTVLEMLTSLTSSGNDAGGPMGHRIAAMLKEQGIDPQIPAYCSELIALAKRCGFRHGPHTLVEIRNSTVHSNNKPGQTAIEAFHEAKHLGLWYIELLLLKMFEYTGEYASRLANVQRAGATELVRWLNDEQS